MQCNPYYGRLCAADWVEAVEYDNTQTVINGGIVTSGTVQLAGNDSTIKAGITGEGISETSVRFWAGATKPIARPHLLGCYRTVLCMLQKVFLQDIYKRLLFILEIRTRFGTQQGTYSK